MIKVISNLAWDLKDEAEAFDVLRSNGISSIEIAPTKVFGDIANANKQSIKKYCDIINNSHINIIALQSLFYGSQINLFDNLCGFIEHCLKNICIASSLGAKYLVFGSPKNRNINKFSKEKADDFAIEVFNQIGNIAQNEGVKFLIEPNSTYYKCNYIINSKEAIELVDKVNNKGFGLHLDYGNLKLENEVITKELIEKADYFHISEKDLKPINNSTFKEIDDLNLNNKYISVEMLNNDMRSLYNVCSEYSKIK